jgi:SpoIID/LytB domain protein
MLPRPLRSAPPALPRLLTGLALLLAGGCRAADGPLPPQALLHWPVSPPAPLNPERPEIWVALAARLAPRPAPAAAVPLRLRAATGSLTLRDAAGRSVSAPELVLAWTRRPLATPLLLRRQVQGPFPSYESAEAAARAWTAGSGGVRIAKPRDWEVWAPAAAPPPPGVVTRLVTKRATDRLLLELRRPGGAEVLQGPLRIEAPGGLAWQGGVYAGPFRLQADAHGSWTLLEQVPLERYLEGVVPHEIGAGAPPAALAAQAVLARTWAVRNRHRFAVDGYHLCADTQCQVYSDPRLAGPAVRQAIAATRARVLLWQGQPIHAVYHATNGGVSAGFEEVWAGAALPYLRPSADGPPAFARLWPLPLSPAGLAGLLRDGQEAYGSDHPRFRWQRSLTPAAVSAALAGEGKKLGVVKRLEVNERGPSGRVLALRIVGSGGSLVLRRDAIRRTFRQLPSTLFIVESAGGGWRLLGGGFGHGAGLSQAGAIDLGRRGWSTAEILRHYYPGTDLQPLRGLEDAP